MILLKILITTTEKIMISKKIQDVVEKALEDNTECRDSDMYLAAYIWFGESQNDGRFKDKSATELLISIGKGKVSNFESISRARRILQQLHPELRGEKYQKRHKKQKEVIDDIQLIKAERTGLGY